jgi:hypothetical protein
MDKVKYRAYHIEAFMDECGKCKRDRSHGILQWNRLLVIKEESLDILLASCEGSLTENITAFKNWYLLTGKFLEEPNDDELPF